MVRTREIVRKAIFLILDSPEQSLAQSPELPQLQKLPPNTQKMLFPSPANHVKFANSIMEDFYDANKGRDFSTQ